jgi:hypothetical protein
VRVARLGNAAIRPATTAINMRNRSSQRPDDRLAGAAFVVSELL